MHQMITSRKTISNRDKIWLGLSCGHKVLADYGVLWRDKKEAVLYKTYITIDCPVCDRIKTKNK